MTTANVYLIFNGNCEAAFNFYKSVFCGEFPYIGKFKDMPPSEDGTTTVTADDAEKIMHVSLPIGNGTMIMGSDTGGEWASNFIQGNNYNISLNTDSQGEADRLFNSLSEGGIVKMPMAKTFWGDYFGMFTDQFGVQWMISFNENQGKG